jgi:hypothetical protein
MKTFLLIAALAILGTTGNPRDAYEIFFLAQVPVWMRGLPIASGIAVASLALVYQPVKIEGNSMTPMLSNHEAIIINMLVYHHWFSATRAAASTPACI